MEHLNTMQVAELENLYDEIAMDFDGEPVPNFTPEQSKVIALAFYLLTSRTNLNWLIDTLMMMMANQDPEMEYTRHTVKNINRFLNALNHPAIRIH